MGWPRPIVEFFGAIVGVDPDHYPKGDEDALRRAADQYDAIAAHLVDQLGQTALQTARSLEAEWNGEGGRALAGQLTNYVNSKDFGGIMAIAVNARDLAQYLRDQADTIARTKMMIWAQVIIGVAMYAIPGGKLISLAFRNTLRKLLRDFITNRSKKAITEGAARAAANKAKVGTGAKIKAIPPGPLRNILVGGGGAVLFGLGPNTAAQIYGLTTGQDGRGEIVAGGKYQHEEGWNGEETWTYTKITAWALPIAIVAGAGVAKMGQAAVSKVGFLNTEAWSWAGRRVMGATAMAASMPAANLIVTGQRPTGEDFWRAAVMGAAMPTHPFGSPAERPSHPDATPVELMKLPESRAIEGMGDRPPPDGPNPPELVVKPEAVADHAATADGTKTAPAAEVRAEKPAAEQVSQQDAAVGVQGALPPSAVAAVAADVSARPQSRTANSTGEGTTSPPPKPPSASVPGDGPGKLPPTNPEVTTKGPANTRPEATTGQTGKADPVADPVGKAAPAEQSGPRVPGTEGQRVPETEGQRVPVSEGQRVPGTEGRVPESEGQRVPETEGKGALAEGEQASPPGAAKDAGRSAEDIGRPPSDGGPDGGRPGGPRDGTTAAPTDPTTHIGGSGTGRFAYQPEHVTMAEATSRFAEATTKHDDLVKERRAEERRAEERLAEVEAGEQGVAGKSGKDSLLVHSMTVERLAKETLASEKALLDVVTTRKAPPTEQARLEARQATEDLAAAQKTFREQEVARDKANKNLTKARNQETAREIAAAVAAKRAEQSAAGRADGEPAARVAKRRESAEQAAEGARDLTKTRKNEFDQASQRLKEASTSRDEAVAADKSAQDNATAARKADEREQNAWHKAESARLVRLAAETNRVRAALTPDQAQRLYQDKYRLEGWEHLNAEENRFLALFESIERTGKGDGKGITLRVSQVEASLVVRAKMMADMYTGEGKTLLAALALGMAAPDGPVHFITSAPHLAAENHLLFRKLLEPLGVDVRMVNVNRPEPPPTRTTVYVGDAAAFGHSMGANHRVPGKHAIVDEIDAVVIDLFNQLYTHSSDGGGIASAKETAAVRLVKRILDEGFDPAHLGVDPAFAKRILDDGAELAFRGLTEPQSKPELTPGGREAFKALVGDRVGTRRFEVLVKRLEADAEARWTLVENQHYLRKVIDGVEKILIISKDFGPLMDSVTLTEQRWSKVAQALEAKHGLEIRADPKHRNAISTGELLKSYDRVSGMSGTAKLGEQQIRELLGPDRVSRVVEIDQFNTPKMKMKPDTVVDTWAEKWDAVIDEVIADMAKDGDPSTGRPNMIGTDHEGEIAYVNERLVDRIRERGYEGKIQIQILNSSKQADFMIAGTYADSMTKFFVDAGQPGMVTIGGRVLGRGVDPNPAAATFKGHQVAAPGARVFTIPELRGQPKQNIEAAEGGIAMRVGYRDEGSPRGTIQAVNRVGRQGAPGEAGVYVSKQDALFLNHKDAPPIAAAYQKQAASRDSAQRIYTEAAIAHAQAVAAQASASAPIATAAVAADVRSAEQTMHQTGEALRRAHDNLRRAEENLQFGAHWDYQERLSNLQPASQNDSVGQPDDQGKRTESPGQVTHTVVPQRDPAESNRPRYRYGPPDLDGDSWMRPGGAADKLELLRRTAEGHPHGVTAGDPGGQAAPANAAQPSGRGVLGERMPLLDEGRLRDAGITRIDAISPAPDNHVRRYVVTLGDRGSFVLTTVRDGFFAPGTAELNDAFGEFRDVEIKFADSAETIHTRFTDHVVQAAEQFGQRKPEQGADQRAGAVDAAYTALKTVDLGSYDRDALRARPEPPPATTPAVRPSRNPNREKLFPRAEMPADPDTQPTPADTADPTALSPLGQAITADPYQNLLLGSPNDRALAELIDRDLGRSTQGLAVKRIRITAAEEQHFLVGGRRVSPHQLAALSGLWPDWVNVLDVDRPSTAATELAQRFANIAQLDIVVRTTDETSPWQVVMAVEDSTLQHEGQIGIEGGKVILRTGTTARQIELTEQHLGTLLGFGGSKAAFALYDKVVLVALPNAEAALDEQIGWTNRLYEMPGGREVIAPIHGRTTLFGSPAFVADRYQAISRDIWGPDQDSPVSRQGLPTRASLDSLIAFRAFCAENRVLPLDLQFGIDRAGRFVAYDINGIRRLDGLANTGFEVLDAWIAWARNGVAAATEPQRPHSSPAGLPVAEVERLAADVRAKLRVSESVEIRVVPDIAALQSAGLAPGHPVAGLYRNENGRHVVYLVAEHLDSRQQVDTTIHHELQHGGLRVLPRADHDRVLAWLVDRYDDARIAPFFGELTAVQRSFLDGGRAGATLSPEELAQVRELAEHAYIEFALTVPPAGPVRTLWHGFLSNVLGPALWRTRVWPSTVGLAMLHDTARRIAVAMRSGQAPRQGADADPHYRAAGPSRGGAPANRPGPTGGVAQRMQRFIDGLASLPNLGGSVYTALPGAVSAGALAGSGQVGLAAAVLGGTAIALPARALINRYADAADRRAKTGWADHRRVVEDRATVWRRVNSGQQAGRPTPPGAPLAADQAVQPRAPLALAQLTAPRSVAAWWTFPLRNAVPVAAGTMALAIVAPPAVVGVAIGLGAAVVGSAQYGLHLRRARLDDVRRAGDYAERSARQLIASGTPASRVLPTGTPLAAFLETAYRDLDEQLAVILEDGNRRAELDQLLEELTRLDGESVRLQGLLDGGAQDIAPLAGSLVAISAALSQYAAALERHGLDPHARLSGPNGTLVSDSVLHHDPLHARNLADLSWSPGRPHRPGVDAENAALVAAKIEQATSGRYGQLSATLIRGKAETGRRLVEIAAELVYDLEQRRTPSWMARDTIHARALRAQVDFYRYLGAEHDQAAPARLTWLAQSGQQYRAALPPATITVPDTHLPAAAVPDNGNGLRSKHLTARAEAVVDAARAHGPSADLTAKLNVQLKLLAPVIEGVAKRLEAKRASVEASKAAIVTARKTLADEEDAKDSGRHARRRAAERDAAKAAVTRDRHAAVAASYEEALRQLEAATAGYLALRSLPAGLEARAREAAGHVSQYLDTMAKIAPPDITLTTGMATGRLPWLTTLTKQINETLVAQGIKETFTADTLQSRLLAEFGQLAGRDGAVLRVGHGAGELRIRLRTAGLTEVLDPPAKASETMIGQLPQGGRSLSITATTKVGAEGGFDVAKLLARASEGSWVWQLGKFLILKLGWSVSRVRSVIANVIEYALGGGVEDNRDESVLFGGSAAWELEVRTDRGGWIDAGTVNTGAARDESELKVYIAHSYTVPAPEQTVQLPAAERNPQLPEHVVGAISGLEAISDRVQGLVDAKLGTVVRDQIHNAITYELPGELRESTGTALIRPLLVDGEVIGHLELRSEVRSAEPLGAAGREHWQEALRVGFSGASGNQSFGRGRSASVDGGIAGLAGHNLFGFGLDLKPPTVSASYRTGRSASQSAGGVGIHVGVQRFTGPTQGYHTFIHHEVKVVLRDEVVTVVKGNSEALLRFKANEAYRHGLAVDPKVLRKDENGEPLLVDGRQSIDGDPSPKAIVPGRRLEFPDWAKELGGAGPWAVQAFTGGDEALRDVMRYLSQQGYLPRLDVDDVPDLSRPAGTDPVEWRGQLANLTELRAQFSALRLETGYDIAAQTGLEFTVVRTRLGHAAESRTLRIDVARDFGKAGRPKVTTSESVVILSIGSNTAGRSGGGSTSVGLAARVAAQLGSPSGFGKAGFARDWSLRGRSAGWSSGGTANQVTLVESTSPVAVFHVPHTLTVTEVESGHEVHHGAQGFGARVSMDSDLLPSDETPAGTPSVAIKGEVKSNILDRGILLGLSAGDLQKELPAAISADPIARRHVATFLNPRNLIAHPEWTQTAYRTRTVVRGGVVPRVAGVSVTGEIHDAKFVAVTDGVGGDINFAMGSHGSDRGTNSGSGLSGSLGGGAGGRAGELGGSRSSNVSQSRGSLQIWGDERLTIEVGRQYVFQAAVDFQLAVTDGPVLGNLATRIAAESADGMALFQLPERDALRFYASNELDLPLHQVADVVERFINRKVSIDRGTLTSLIRRYHSARTAAVAAGEPIPVLSEKHSAQVMAAELGKAVGLAVAEQRLDEVLVQAEEVVATVQKVSLPEYDETTMGDSLVESAGLSDQKGPVRLLDSVTRLVSQVLGHPADSDLVLAESLYVDLAGKRWWGRIDDMLDPGGFVRSYLSTSTDGSTQQKITVRIKAWFKEDTAQSLGETAEVVALAQDYEYKEASHAEAGGQATGVRGSYSTGHGGSSTVGTDRSGGVRATVGTQLTELKRKGSFGAMARIQRELLLEIEVVGEPVETSGQLRRGIESAVRRADAVDQTESVELSGQVVQLIPAALVSHETSVLPRTSLVDHRKVRLPSNYKVAGTVAFGRGNARKNELVDALAKELGGRVHRVELENLFSASGRKAKFPAMATEDGYRLVPLPVPGRPRQVVQVRVQAQVYDAELVAGPMGDSEIGQVNRSQHTTSTAVSLGRALPLSGGLSTNGSEGSPLQREGLNGGVSVGEQVTDRVSDTSGVRRERSRFEKGDDVVIVRLRVGYNLWFEKKRLLNDGGERRIRDEVKKPWAATGEAYVTMFKHQYDAMRAEQESLGSGPAGRSGVSQYLTMRPWVIADPRQPSRVLTDALTRAHERRVELRLTVTEADGTDRSYVVSPDGRLHGDERDGGFAEDFATVHPRLVQLAEENGIDLRALHASRSTGKSFSETIRDALKELKVSTDLSAGLRFPTEERPRPGQAPTGQSHQASGPSTPPVIPVTDGGASGNAAALGRMATTEGRTQERVAEVETSLRGLLAGVLIGPAEFASVAGLDRVDRIDAMSWRVWRGGRSHDVAFRVGPVARHALAGFAPAPDGFGTTVTVSPLLIGDAEVLSAVGHELRELSELPPSEQSALNAGPDVLVPGPARADGVLPSPHDRGREAQLALLGWVADRVPASESAAGVRADLALLDAVIDLGLLPGAEGADQRLAMLDPAVEARLRSWMSWVTDDAGQIAGTVHHTPVAGHEQAAAVMQTGQAPRQGAGTDPHYRVAGPSRGAEAPTGLTAAHLWRLLDRQRAQWPIDVELHVVQVEEELVEISRAAVHDLVEGVYVGEQEDGRAVVALAGDRYPTEEAALTAVSQALLEHFGPRVLQAGDWQAVLDRVTALREEAFYPHLLARSTAKLAGLSEPEAAFALLSKRQPEVLRAWWATLLLEELRPALSESGLTIGNRNDAADRLGRAIERTAVAQVGRPARTYREQARGGPGSIHRSRFRGDGRTEPAPAAVRATAHGLPAEIAAAVARAQEGRSEATVRRVAITGDRFTIGLSSGEVISTQFEVTGDFTNAGPIRWEQLDGSAAWASITLSPRAQDDIIGRALANAAAQVVAAYQGESRRDQAWAGRRAEVAFLVAQLEVEGLGSGLSSRPYDLSNLRSELRLLLHHMNKDEKQPHGLPPLPPDLRHRVEQVLRRDPARVWVADNLLPWLNGIEDLVIEGTPAVRRLKPSNADVTAGEVIPSEHRAVDAFLHRLFQQFAAQPASLAGHGDSPARLKLLREQPLLRHLVDRYGAGEAIELGRLGPEDFAFWMDTEDRQAVADVFAQLASLVAQRDQAASWWQRRAAASDFAELAATLGLQSVDGNLRAALPSELSAAVAALKPGLAQRLQNVIENGVTALPSIRSELVLGFVETAPPGVVSAVVLVQSGRVGLAAAVLGGTALAWPARALVNRYTDAADERAKSDRRSYRRDLEDITRSRKRAGLVDSVLTPYQRLLETVSGQAGWQPEGPNPRRAPLTPPGITVPPATAPWWTFPLRTAVPVAAAALPLAIVVPPVAVGAIIGLAAAVAGTAQYRFARLQARLDDERRARDYEWRSWRQLVSDMRLAADALERLRALSNELPAGGAHLLEPVWDLEGPIGQAGRDVPAKAVFAARELLMSAVPFAQRTASIYVQQQLASAGAALLEALVRLGAIGVVSGVIEALLAEANRHAVDRRMHNWVELLRTEIQAQSDLITDPVLARFDEILETLRAKRAAEEGQATSLPAMVAPQIPPEQPWSPVLHPEREASTGRRWYVLGSVAIGGAGIGVAAAMVHAYDLDPVYLDLAWVAGLWQPVSYYTKYLRRRMRVQEDFAERDRSTERRSADEVERDRAAANYLTHHVGRFQDLVDGRRPRSRDLPAGTPLAAFIEGAYRDLDDHLAGNVEERYRQSPELLRLLEELSGLDGERDRLQGLLDDGGHHDIAPLAETLIAISDALSQYATAAQRHGVDPQVRLSGPSGYPVSDSVLHHDPLHARNLMDLTWGPGRHHRPGVEAENAALIAAKVEQATSGRYGPISAADVRAKAEAGRRLVDIAADLVYELQRRRVPSWMARDTVRARALRAKVEFYRTLTADHARAVPARLSWLAQTPATGPSAPPALPAGHDGGSGNAAALGRMATTEGRTQHRVADVERSLRNLLAGDLIELAEFARTAGLERIEPIDAMAWRVWRAGQSHEVVFGVGVVADHALAGFAPTEGGVGTTVTVSPLLVGDAEVLSAVGHELRELSELRTSGADVFVPGPARADGARPSAHDWGRETQLALLGWAADRVPESEPAAGVRADLALLDAVTHLGLLPGTEGADQRLAMLDQSVAARIRTWMSSVTGDADRISGLVEQAPAVGQEQMAAAVGSSLDALRVASRPDRTARAAAVADARDALALAMIAAGPEAPGEQPVRGLAAAVVRTGLSMPVEELDEFAERGWWELARRSVPAAGGAILAWAQQLAGEILQQARPLEAVVHREVLDIARESGSVAAAAQRAADTIDAYLLDETVPANQLLRRRADRALQLFLLTRAERLDSETMRLRAGRAIRLAARAAGVRGIENTQAGGEVEVAVAAVATFLRARTAERARVARTEAEERLIFATYAPRFGYESEQAIALVHDALKTWSGSTTPDSDQSRHQIAPAPRLSPAAETDGTAMQKAVAALTVVFLAEQEQRPRAIDHAVDRLLAARSLGDRLDQAAVTSLEKAMDLGLGPDEEATSRAAADAAAVLSLDLMAASARDRAASARWIQLVVTAAAQVWSTDEPARAEGAAAETAWQIVSFWSGERTMTEAASLLIWASTVLAATESDPALTTLRAVLAAAPAVGLGAASRLAAEAFDSVATWYGDSTEPAQQRATRAITEAMTSWASDGPQLQQIQAEAASGWISPVTDAAQRAFDTFQAYLLGKNGPDQDPLRMRADHALQHLLLISEQHDIQNTAQEALVALRATAPGTELVEAVLRIRAADYMRSARLLAKAAVAFTIDERRPDTALRAIEVIQDERTDWTASIPADAPDNVRAARLEPTPAGPARTALSPATEAPVARKVAGWAGEWLREHTSKVEVLVADPGPGADRFRVKLSGHTFAVTVGLGRLPEGMYSRVSFEPGSLDPAITVSDRLSLDLDRRYAARCGWLELAAVAALVNTVAVDGGRVRRGVPQPGEGNAPMEALFWATSPLDQGRITPALRVEAELVLRGFLGARMGQVGEREYEISVRLAARVVEATLIDQDLRWQHFRYH
ncbi:hypothetical protein [Kribbella catacumbae]|uniref:WXG100-like domain-containing protein n=1 Tax=Kribbella catacumbae TaxID=460086 RepID=UPI000373135D|nr:hypothetical protein [Kribbella catacumbae]